MRRWRRTVRIKSRRGGGGGVYRKRKSLLFERISNLVSRPRMGKCLNTCYSGMYAYAHAY